MPGSDDVCPTRNSQSVSDAIIGVLRHIVALREGKLPHGA